MPRPPRHPDAPKPAKKAKPDWFPTTEHLEGLATFKDWMHAILARSAALGAEPEHRARVYRNVIEGHVSPWQHQADFDWRGVRSAAPYETILLGATLEKTNRGSEIRTLVDSELAGAAPRTHEATLIRRTKEIDDLEERWRQLIFQRLYERHFVAVDLSLDDKTLTRHFSEWLKVARESEGLQRRRLRKSAITTQTLQHWNDSMVLAAYDLMEWRKLTRSTYSDSAIAAWLWPDDTKAATDDYINLAERFRKVTKPLMRAIFDIRMVLRLDRAWAQEKYGWQKAE